MSSRTDLLAALADEARLRVFSAVLLGAPSADTAAAATGVRLREVLRALVVLESAGLVERAGEGWVARPIALRDAVRDEAVPRAYVDHGTADERAAAVLRTFMPEGRIEQMPSTRSKRLVVLDQVSRVFEPGVHYREPDVNALLGAFHPDYAALRRYLVDEGFLAREDGTYWRIGGTVDVTES